MVKRKNPHGMKSKENTTMKKNILSLAALLIASATFVACSSDDNIISEQPANPTGKYTMTINASKGDGATTRALTLTGKTLTATWATTENIYVKKGETWATGSLQPDADGTTATLKGELSGITIAKDDVLTLQFPKSGAISYDGQVGTLENIAANFDYATASVIVESVSASGNIVPTAATTTFENQQAIVKFTLIDKADGLTPLSAKQLVVSDGTNTYTVNPAPATSEIYVAIPGISGQTVTLTATVGEDTYTFEKAGVTFDNGQYYEITVKMTKYVPTLADVFTDGAVVGVAVKNTYNTYTVTGTYSGGSYTSYTKPSNDIEEVTMTKDGNNLVVWIKSVMNSECTLTFNTQDNTYTKSFKAGTGAAVWDLSEFVSITVNGTDISTLTDVTPAAAETIVTWTSSDMPSNFYAYFDGWTYNNTHQGITVTASGDAQGGWSRNGIDVNEGSGTITFTSSVGNIKSIVITADNMNEIDEWSAPTGWTANEMGNNPRTLSWSGTASTTVNLPLSEGQNFSGISTIVFTLE